MSTGRVVVLGGGLAGITAALDCAAGGAEVTLVEVRPRLGGAAYSFRRDGLWLDNGQHVFLRCCSAYRELLARIGSTADTFLQERLSIPVLAPGRGVAWLRRTNLPAPLQLAGSLLRYPYLSFPERLMVARAMLALRGVEFDDRVADERSFGTWLEQQRQGPRALDALWQLIARPTLNLSAPEASLAAAAFVFKVGLLERTDAGDIGYARRPLQRVHGDAALESLRGCGVDVKLGLRAEAIEVSGGGVRAVAAQGELLDADAVVLAVPHERVIRLLPQGALRDPGELERLGSSPIINLHVIYDRPVLRFEFAAAVCSPVQFVFDRTVSSGVPRGQCVALSLSAAEEEARMSAEDLRARFLPALQELLPDTRSARVEEFIITREHAATFRAAPGVRRLRPGPRTAIGGLALAGAWTDTGWPATMEGAVRSGHKAAEVALASLGHERAISSTVA